MPRAGACRSTCAAAAPATAAAPCRCAAASCCRWSGSTASSRSTSGTCWSSTEPNVDHRRLQDEVEKVGLFYPPDPASLDESVIGGNIAECAGGPRAFKYGTTRRYVLGLEVVLPTGEVIRTGSKAVKNVVGYDLTQLLVGSEGTLAIITQVVLRLIPKPPAHATLRATFDSIDAAVEAVNELIRARVVPATLELVDGECLDAVTPVPRRRPSWRRRARRGLLILEVDGMAARRRGGGAPRRGGVPRRRRDRGAARGHRGRARSELWRVRRELSPALKTIATMKINQDVVVPRGRVPELFRLVGELKPRVRRRASRASATPATATST